MSQKKMVAGYDELMLAPLQSMFYGFSDYHNFGYWTEGIKTAGQASENLVAKLLSFIPEKKGRILDVACGLGATTRQVLDFYKPEDVVGINVSEVQLSRSRENAPGVDFRLMDATKLDFPDESFDNIICVEAAFHFDTREQFLAEALRVLKPGGRLVHSDILVDHLPKTAADRMQLPPANYLESPQALKERIRSVGFADVMIMDTTEETWHGFMAGLRRFQEGLLSWPGQDKKKARAAMSRTSFLNPVTFGKYLRYYCLACSQKGPVG